ncbi:Beta-galactosidase [Actinidia chinensis var. chinensis]|uniref:Beta-galactosidase n=1 Tax=Actinidia chinensis var. chinensis TaxID=1590841 RepID=A0A2R6S071_ACTCC|nr:Beta-galactosidase [Actinidia chinensis var. chinensis]
MFGTRPIPLQCLAVALTLHLAVIAGEFFKPFNVSYDHRALIIDGNRRMLISAGIHYPRATPEMWPDLVAKSKEGGADVIETYAFWNGHEPVKGQYNFEGRYDIVKFVKLVGSSGLYLHLRIGPYVCAEWNFGGFPVWLRDVPGIEFRTENAPFKNEMQRFVKKIVDLMREEMLFSWQGGPIILLQIENEYGDVEGSYGEKGKEYVKWAAKMATGLGAGVPWVMCKQVDAPEYILDACNGYYCDGFRPNSYKKPVLWTENWDGWYTQWGGRLPHRPVEDLAFAVARFFQRGGSFQNYYMFFGGTNFGRTSGGPNQLTSYDYDAPLDEYGLLRQPKWGHLKDLHAAIKLCEPALVAVDSPQYIKLGPMQEAHVYGKNIHRKGETFTWSGNKSRCSAFLANIDEHNEASVTFFGEVYTLPPWSVSILPDCKNTVYNTAKVGAQTSIKTTELSLPLSTNVSVLQQLPSQDEVSPLSENWVTVKEPIGAWGDDNFTVQGILQHLNVTKDISDYLWYMTRVYVYDDDISFWEENSVEPALTIDSMRDLVHIFINGKLIGSVFGHWVKVDQPLQLMQGYNDIVLLSETIGLQNFGAFLEKDGAGFKGQIKLTGFRNGDINLTDSLWTYQVGLKGEFLKIYNVAENETAGWTDLTLDAIPSSFSWYKTYFDAPVGMDPVALDFRSMGKGQAWVNGHHIGRYWTLVAPKDGCQSSCNYRGAYHSDKCTTNCGKPTQIWYHVPRSWLQSTNNLLVIFEETGGNPFEISIKPYSTHIICGQVSESHYPPLRMWFHPNFVKGKISASDMIPEIHFHCDDGHKISSIEFASYGTPKGSCQKFSKGNCHAPNSLSVVSQACEGRNRCSVRISNAVFGGDPCHGTVKTLAVEARCVPSSNIGFSAQKQ